MNKNDIAQQMLLREVGRVLNESDIRPTDNFIELGGNSFLAVQLAIHLREKEKVEINIAQLLGDRLENIFLKFIENKPESSE